VHINWWQPVRSLPTDGAPLPMLTCGWHRQQMLYPTWWPRSPKMCSVCNAGELIPCAGASALPADGAPLPTLTCGHWQQHAPHLVAPRPGCAPPGRPRSRAGPRVHAAGRTSEFRLSWSKVEASAGRSAQDPVTPAGCPPDRAGVRAPPGNRAQRALTTAAVTSNFCDVHRSSVSGR